MLTYLPEEEVNFTIIVSLRLSLNLMICFVDRAGHSYYWFLSLAANV